MCGIAGWLTTGDPVDVSILESMTGALAHRGPDATGVHVDGRVGLGHRRLSVIDTAHTADQPMHDMDGLYTIVFNGEIYNFSELRARLETLGHRFRTRSDTEVILEAYKRYGPECVTHFNGMFAFALWDRRHRCLFLARDRAGEKPLFFARTAAGLIFASEPRALKRHPSVGQEVDFASLVKYLKFNYVPGSRTLSRSIQKLPPGCTMTASLDGSVAIERYWSLAPHFARNHGFADVTEAADALRSLIDEATRLRMVSDVPLGAFLSSGVDSATIVAAMKHNAGSVQTFSIGFDSGDFDETQGARETARALGVWHADQRFDLDPAAMIAAIVHAADEPIADNSTVPTWVLSRFAREHVTVALSGDGGDELFGGYDTYIAARLARSLALLPRGLLSAAASTADRCLPVSFNKVTWDYKARHFLRGLTQGWPQAHFSWRTVFSLDEQSRILRPDWQAELKKINPDEEFEAAYLSASGSHYLDRAMNVDACTWLVDDVLVKVDRMSMAHGLEVRAPLLDHRVMELAASLPADWKVRFGRTKSILKDSQKARLSGSVLSRKKLGFNSPMSLWLLGPLRTFARDQLASRAIDNWLVRSEVDRLWTDHEARIRDNGFKLFGLVMLSLWLNQR